MEKYEINKYLEKFENSFNDLRLALDSEALNAELKTLNEEILQPSGNHTHGVSDGRYRLRLTRRRNGRQSRDNSRFLESEIRIGGEENEKSYEKEFD